MPLPSNLIFALPKGRILTEALPLLERIGVQPETEFFNRKSRKLQFSSNVKGLHFVRTRSFDVPTFVGSGAAAMGIAGKDVLAECEHDSIYAPLDLGIGKCRLSEAAPKQDQHPRSSTTSHIRVATKYPNLTKRFYASKGVQAECIKLHGAMELAPALGMCSRIVDLVSTGATLKENGLTEKEVLMDVTSVLIVNRNAFTFFRQDICNIIFSLEDVLGNIPAS